MNAVIGFAQVLLRQRSATLGVQQVTWCNAFSTMVKPASAD